MEKLDAIMLSYYSADVTEQQILLLRVNACFKEGFCLEITK